MKINNKQSESQETTPTQGEEVSSSNYLVTEAVDPQKLGNEKVESDLSIINEAEEKQAYKADISKGLRDPQVKRAVSALRLKNPFKGF